MLYEQYISSNSWATKRQQRREIDKNECRLCGSKEQLEVHHKPDSYKKIPNESVEDDLTTICVFCHDLITNRIREMRYTNRSIIPNTYTENIRKVDNNGRMDDVKIQAHRGLPNYIPQRTTIEPNERILERD